MFEEFRLRHTAMPANIHAGFGRDRMPWLCEAMPCPYKKVV